MKKCKWMVLAVAVVMLLSIAGSARAEGEAKGYVGAKTCKMCHSSKAKGAQFAKWQASGHSKANATLATDAAKEVAKKAGVEGDTQKSDKCLKCNRTGNGTEAKLFGKKFKVEDGVQCESCHGPGKDYMKMSVMKDPALAKAAGLVKPNEKVCISCHNKDFVGFEGFDFDEYFKKIAHPNPKNQ